MKRFSIALRFAVFVLTAMTCVGGVAQAFQRGHSSYDVVLHSSSLSEMRVALSDVVTAPDKYLARIREDLRRYPRRLKRDPVAANRSVYVATLIRDPSFIPILVKLLGDRDVVDECIYSCAPVFALSIYANFASWKIPSGLNSQLTTVQDLRGAVDSLSRLRLERRPITDVVEGPALEEHRHQIEGKTEEELIALAGPNTGDYEVRQFAAFALEASVVQSKNRLEFYLLAMNDISDDASREVLNAVHWAINRAELARSVGR